MKWNAGVLGHFFLYYEGWNEMKCRCFRALFPLLWRLFFLFCLLLILRFGDEVDFSAGFLAWPVGSLGATKPIRLAARPTRSSYSVFHITVDSLGRTWVPFRLAFRLSAGWWAYSAILLSRPSADFSEGFSWQIPAQWKDKGFSRRYYTLILAKRPRSDLLYYEGWNEMKCRCFRPLFCTMKAELGIVIKLCVQSAVSKDRIIDHNDKWRHWSRL